MMKTTKDIPSPKNPANQGSAAASQKHGLNSSRQCVPSPEVGGGMPNRASTQRRQTSGKKPMKLPVQAAWISNPPTAKHIALAMLPRTIGNQRPDAWGFSEFVTVL